MTLHITPECSIDPPASPAGLLGRWRRAAAEAVRRAQRVHSHGLAALPLLRLRAALRAVLQVPELSRPRAPAPPPAREPPAPPPARPRAGARAGAARPAPPAAAARARPRAAGVPLPGRLRRAGRASRARARLVSVLSTTRAGGAPASSRLPSVR